MAHAMKNAFKSFDRLKQSGVPEAQARSIIEIIEEASDFSFKELATKNDLKMVQAELKADIQELRSELKTDIQELRNEFKAETQELRSELKADIQELRVSMHWLQRFFFSGVLLIVVNIAVTLLHH